MLLRWRCALCPWYGEEKSEVTSPCCGGSDASLPCMAATFMQKVHELLRSRSWKEYHGCLEDLAALFLRPASLTRTSASTAGRQRIAPCSSS